MRAHLSQHQGGHIIIQTETLPRIDTYFNDLHLSFNKANLLDDQVLEYG